MEEDEEEENEEDEEKEGMPLPPYEFEKIMGWPHLFFTYRKKFEKM